MLFNSLNFALFLPVVFVLYWFVTNKSLKLQNLLLLVSSYFFYACWDYRFLFLLIFSTGLDFYTGRKIFTANTVSAKRFWLWLSVSINLGFLAVFKYYNFFAAEFSTLFMNFGFKPSFTTLNIILPVGISFYTFHGLSYVFDIYRKRITPCDDFVNYSVFVSFFPLLVAGPIERATHLLPQIEQKRVFNYNNAINGLKQILWGFFKKIAIADNCAEFANMIFNNHAHYPGSTLVLGAVLFAIQIYCDFSGYSDIALGVARLFGIELLRNFAYPYFSRDIAEFWRRWHISLSSWFKDYLYIPLGGSRGSTWLRIRNTFIIFIVSGFWHGANWTFLTWGALHAVFLVPLLLSNSNRANIDIVAQGRTFPTIKELWQMLSTFALVAFALIFFRSDTVTAALQYIGGMFSASIFTIPTGDSLSGGSSNAVTIIILTIIFILMEWAGREQLFAIASTGLKWPRPLRWGFYLTIVVAIFYFCGVQQQFVYFQF